MRVKNLIIACGILFLLPVTICGQSAPTITSFSPTFGPIGTTVTITGANFDPISSSNYVFFGATQAMVTSATTTSLTVTVPIGATYQFITVTNSSNLTGYSTQPFLTTFSCGGVINANSFAPKVDMILGQGPTSGIGVNKIGDYDGDGKPDIAVVNANTKKVSVLRSTSTAGDISFASQIDFSTGDSPQSLSIGDIDGDGKLDIAVGNFTSATVSVYRNTSTIGNISFDAKVDYAVGNGAQRVAIGDLDSDGKPDIAVTNYNSNTVSVLRNTSIIGIVSFANKIDYSALTRPYGVSIGDLDGDENPDLVVTNQGLGTVSLYKNTSTIGNINFAPKVDFAIGSDPREISIGDLDNDGKADLAVANFSPNTVSVLRNISTSGVFSFATVAAFGIINNPGSVSIGDIDGDGKPDLALINYLSSSVSVLKNTCIAGVISFAPKLVYNTGERPYFISIGDLDSDSKPDLVVSNLFSHSVSVLRNTITSSATPAVSLTATTTTICAGNSVMFTGSATNTGGGIVNYNFKVNGSSVQNGTSNNYITPTLANGNIVTCSILVTGGTCLTTNTAISNAITMVVNANHTPLVSITAAPSGAICASTSVTFTAMATNTGGGTLNYNFKLNGTTVQNSVSNTYTTSTLVNGDGITCTITATGGICLTSNTATATPIIIEADNQNPIITCPANVIINHGEDTSPASRGTASATDNCSGVNVTYSDVSTQTANGNGYTNYIITRTWKATDATGNTATCNQIIKVCQMSVSLGSNKYVLYGALGYTGCGLLTPVITGGLAPFTYLWTSDDVSVNGLTTATATSCNTQEVVRTYTVVVTSANGCTAAATVSLTFININCSNNNNTVKVKVCHIPPGNPSNCNTICVSVNAVQTLLNSGSYLGECLPLCEVPPLGFTDNQNISDYIIKKEAFVKKDEKMSNDLFDVKVLNNPTENFFKLYVISNDLYKKVSVRLMDINGKLLEHIENLHVYQEIRIGDKFVSGVYIAEVVQGGSRKVVRLVKHN